MTDISKKKIPPEPEKKKITAEPLKKAVSLTPQRKKLTAEQAKVFEKHILNIRAEQKALQKDLEAFGFKPVGGWAKPEDFRLVSGLHLANDCDDTGCLDDGCDECSVVCFDDDCPCCECAGDVVNFKDLTISMGRPPGTKYFVESIGRKGIQIYIRTSKKFK
jgi:hypothetical protein